MGATLADAERLIANPDEVDVEANGKRHYIGFIRGRRVRVVLVAAAQAALAVPDRQVVLDVGVRAAA